MEIRSDIIRQMRANYDGLLKSINRANTDKLLDWLERHNFYEVPASVKHHNSFRGGLLKHSLEVCNEGLALFHEYQIQNNSNDSLLSKESVAICCLLHDICKWNNYYISPYDNQVKGNKKTIAEGHGQKSVKILEDIGYPLSKEEKMAIWWHMGKDYEPSYKDHTCEYDDSTEIPLCNLVRKADHNASKMKEVFEELIRSLNLTNGERLIRYLNNSSFYDSGCGSHHKYPNGLVAHSLGVYRHIMEICSPDEKHEAAIVALLHDIAMQNRSKYYVGHGYRSMIILKKRLEMDLPDSVLNMIWFHKNSHRPRPQEEMRILNETRKNPIHRKLVESDHFDADHDLTDVLLHYREW